MLRLSAASLFVLGLSAGDAAADLSADDVWQDWQTLLTDLGYTVRGAPERVGNRLIIPDLGLAQTLPDAGGLVNVRLGRIALQERGDGTVAVIYPETMPMAMAMMPEDGEAVTATLTMRHDGLEIIASGSPERLLYEYTADDLTIELGQMTIDGKPVDAVKGVLRLAAVAGTSEGVAEDGARLLKQEMSAGSVGYSFAFDDPQSDASVDYEGEAESLDYDGRLRLPDGHDIDDLSAAIRAGLRIENRLIFGPGESRFRSTEDGVAARGNSRSDATGIEMTLSDAGLVLGLHSDAVAARMEGGGLPPLAYEVERAVGRLTMPVAKGDAVQGFGLTLDVRGVTLSENVWAMLDPGATLPRDPANLTVDLSGRGKLFVDLFDEAAMAAFEAGDSTAFVPERLVLDTLLLEFAGARLTGAGAVDIKPDADAQTELPLPEGAVDLRLEGGNGLLDQLVKIGLLPKDQAMTVRMMAAMFAEAVEGEDTLTSRVEIRKDGTVSVNGQRMR